MVRKLLCVAVLVACAANSQAIERVASPGEISGNGEASVLLAPDTARVTLRFEGSAASAQEVEKALEKKIQAVTTAVKKVAENATVQRRMQRFISGDEKEPAMIAGRPIEGEVSLLVETSDLAKVSAVIDTALASGANTIGDVRYLVKDGTAARTAALREAVKRAEDQARAAAAALGATLGELISADIGEDANGGALEKLRDESSPLGDFDDKEYYVYVTLRFAVEKKQ